MMKRLLPAAAALTTALLASVAQAADVGVSISVSQPGVYGRIDLGRFPQPQVIVTQPVIIVQPEGAPVVISPEPGAPPSQ